MMGRGSWVAAARLLCAAATAALIPARALAQQPPAPQPPTSDPAQLDPNAPLAPMPDLGVDWPDLNVKETAPQPGAPAAVPQRARKRAPASVANEQGQIRYTVAVEGLSAVGGAEDVLKAFRAQSTLEAQRKNSANAAQIGRRASADADLLAQLLRSQGYYDAVVEPSTEGAGGQLRVVLTADPGQQYRFASVELPG